MLNDLDKGTVDFVPNYDGSLTEPVIFPSLLPMLLLNGTSGIAVGMATSIPPHNLGELIDAFTYYVDNHDVTVADLMKIMPGPDFPTGGYIFGQNMIRTAYETGKGSFVVRAKAVIETDNKGRQKIVVTEIPYQTNKAKIIENIAELVKGKRIEGISDLRDESDRDGLRIVIEIKKDEIPEVILNSLFKHTQLQSSYSIILLAIVNQQPKQFNLIDYFNYFLGHRKEIIRRRSIFELDKAEKRAHIIEGLKIALSKLDLVIKIIRTSKNRLEARNSLTEKISLTQVQADAILDMQLYRLTGLEIEKLENEYIDLIKLINYLKELLASERLLLNLIKEELRKVKEQFADKRRTEIVEKQLSEFKIEDMIKDEDFVISYTRNGYIKRTTLSSYRSLHRGTMGKKGIGLKEEDAISRVFVASAHAYILAFTEKGRMFWIKVYDIPEGDSAGRGKPINRLIGIGPEERVCSVINVKEFSADKFVMLFSKMGYVKKTSLDEFSRPRINGIIAAEVPDGDLLLEAQITNGNNEIILGTYLGKALKFNEENVRPMGRGARGVIAIKLGKDDFVVGADMISENDKYILTVTENGVGKKSDLALYRLQNRGGKGLINIKITEKLGKVIGLVTLNENDREIILCSEKGIVNKQDTAQVRSKGRATQGVKLINLKPGDRLVAIEKVKKEAD
jgi:DNA gyrase subunit A